MSTEPAAGEGTDTIVGFHSGSDLIGLAGGLALGDLSFSGSDIIAGSETLASLAGVEASSLDEFDFVML